jgi:L-Ala-D/L-Glu epimerase
MELSIQPYRLEFRHPFGLSSHTRKETPAVFIRLTHHGMHGYGEACLPPYLGETMDGTIQFLDYAAGMLARADPYALHACIAEVHALGPGCMAAKAAIDMALHDLAGKRAGLPCWQMFGLYNDAVPTSFTIAIDAEDRLEQKVHEASDYQVLKIKAGTRNDKQLIRAIRKFTRKPLYVDVNQGWKEKHFVLDMILWMREQNVVLIEQPMPVHMLEETEWVTEKSPLPVLADESVRDMADLRLVNGVFSGANLKLMKCGGIAAALEMCSALKRKGLKVMLGCMAESSCGTSAMAQLASLGDYIDLDAPKLYKNDPFIGVEYRHGRLIPTHEPGLGVRPRNGLFG